MSERTWACNVGVLLGKYWIGRTLSVTATTPHVAAARALRAYKREMPKGRIVTGFRVTGTAVKALLPGRYATEGGDRDERLRTTD